MQNYASDLAQQGTGHRRRHTVTLQVHNQHRIQSRNHARNRASNTLRPRQRHRNLQVLSSPEGLYPSAMALGCRRAVNYFVDELHGVYAFLLLLLLLLLQDGGVFALYFYSQRCFSMAPAVACERGFSMALDGWSAYNVCTTHAFASRNEQE